MSLRIICGPRWRHRTWHRRTARRVVAASAAASVLTVTGVLYAAGGAQAQLDPHVPVPPFWCPGNGPGVSASGWGGYCEGKSFPDGTRLNTFRLGYWWQPLRCIVFDGTANPPLAGPGGCGGFLG